MKTLEQHRQKQMLGFMRANAPRLRAEFWEMKRQQAMENVVPIRKGI